MHLFVRLMINIAVALIGLSAVCGADPRRDDPLAGRSPFGTPTKAGNIESNRLVECSGVDTSLADDDILWAINDSGNGPFLFALGVDGSHRARIRVSGAHNRDWEALDTFVWNGCPMILIADIGDNRQQHDTHTLYVVEEPRMPALAGMQPMTIRVAWTIVYAYPDGRHDAEGVCIDRSNGQVLIVTKRDDPPLVFALPIQPTQTGDVVTARRVAAITRIPAPTDDDRWHPYGHLRSQPTAMDISVDGNMLAVLTYKHAYLFKRSPNMAWRTTLNTPPVLIPLPLPQADPELSQREAICFGPHDQSLWVISEGRGAAIVQIPRAR